MYYYINIMIIDNIITFIILILYLSILYLSFINNNNMNMIIITILTYFLIYYNKQIFKNKNKESFKIGSQNDTNKIITITNNNFSPKTIDINIGDTIVWSNNDRKNSHKIRIFKNIQTIYTTPDIFYNEEEKFIFTKSLFNEGIYNYESLTNNMLGIININDPSKDSIENSTQDNITNCYNIKSQSQCLKNNKCKYDFENNKCIYKNISIESKLNTTPESNNIISNRSSNNTNSSISIPNKIKDTDPIPIIKLKDDITNYNMSSFDGLCINTGNEDSWRKSPDNLPLIDDSDLYTFQGHNNPLKNIIPDYTSLYGPSIDGDENSPNKLFMFSNNLSSPACCPSTFTTSTGCICTSKKQRDFVISRGNNIPKKDSEDIS